MAVAAGRFGDLVELNQEFHKELAAAGQNRVLGELLQRLRERTAMLFAPMSASRQARSWNEHSAILRAIIDGDERTAATLATDHVMRAGADFLAGLDELEPDLRLSAVAEPQNEQARGPSPEAVAAQRES